MPPNVRVVGLGWRNEDILQLVRVRALSLYLGGGAVCMGLAKSACHVYVLAQLTGSERRGRWWKVMLEEHVVFMRSSADATEHGAAHKMVDI